MHGQGQGLYSMAPGLAGIDHHIKVLHAQDRGLGALIDVLRQRSRHSPYRWRRCCYCCARLERTVLFKNIKASRAKQPRARIERIAHCVCKQIRCQDQGEHKNKCRK